MTDTTTLLAEAERLAKTLDGEAEHRKTAEAIGDTDHVAWCDWMLSIGTTLRALAAALRQARTEAHSEIETRFWTIVDRDGLAGVPSDMWDALSRIVRAATDQRKLAQDALARCRTLAAALRQARTEGMREAAALIECGCRNRHDVVAQRPNSAARWNLCEHPQCMMIEVAAILAAADAKENQK